MPKYPGSPATDFVGAVNTTAELPATSHPGHSALVLSPLTLYVYTDTAGWQPLASLQGATPPPLGNHNLYSISHPDVGGVRADGDVLVWRPNQGASGIYDHQSLDELLGSPVTKVRIFHDFLNLSGTGWSTISVDTSLSGAVAGEQGRPGIYRLSTGATSGTMNGVRISETAIGGGGVVGSVHPAELFDMSWAIRLGQSDTNTLVRFGLGLGPTADPPADGLYFEKLAADTSWFGVTRSGGAQSRTAAIGATSTAWITARLRRIDASTVGFSFTMTGAGPELTATASIPTTALQPFLHIKNSAAAAKTVDVDYMDLLLPLSR